MPWPISTLPVYAVTVPSAATAIQESNFEGSIWEACVSNGPWANANEVAREAVLKLTTSAPEPLRKSRREKLMLSSHSHIYGLPAACVHARSSGTARRPGLHQSLHRSRLVFGPAPPWR